jgi:predicted metal-dependent hydrolase
MAQKVLYIPGVGDVLFAKRRGTRNLKLSIRPNGQIRVSLPQWAPYSTAAAFVKSRRHWIDKNRIHTVAPVLRPDDSIGPNHKLVFKASAGNKTVSSRITPSTIEISTSLPYDHPEVQARTLQAGERLLKAQALGLLPKRLEQLARVHNFKYKEVKIRKLTSRWGSCSSDKSITLSYFLLQLPYHLQDYVILHELVHTKHLHHGPGFWSAFDNVLPGAKKIRNEIRGHKPRIEPFNRLVVP